MQSLRSRIIIGLIKNRHLFKFQWKPQVIDGTFDVEEFRRTTDKAAALMNRKVEKSPAVSIQGIRGEWIEETGCPAEKVILYIHGGGFISGSIETHRSHVRKFVKASGVKALLFDYRLAPEHPYPAALEDILTVYEGLLGMGYKGQDVLIAGESAGGTLTLSALKAIRDRELPRPAGGVFISPVRDRSCTADSFRRNAPKDIAPRGDMRVWTDYYRGTADHRDPLLSPQFGKLNDLSETLLIIGSDEIHYDDTLQYYRNCRAAGSPVVLMEYSRMVHAFPIMAPLFPEAVRAMEDIAAFIRKRLNLPGM